MPVLAVAQITITDLNDAIIAGTAPPNPVNGTLWIDDSSKPPVLKVWSSTRNQWEKQPLSLEGLDLEAWQQLQEMERNILDIADDKRITQGERISIRERVIATTGVTALTNTLPIITAIDTSKLGEVYSVRLEARNAGVATNHADYAGLEAKYVALKAYLETLTPRPWDTTVVDVTPVTSTWYDNWKNYWEAVAKLRTTISEQQKKNADEAENTANRLSTRGVGLKDGYSSFTTAAAGQIYFHGYDKKGNPVDGDPYLVVNGVNKPIKKGTLNPGGTFDRGYLMYDDTNSCWYLSRTEAGIWKRYNVGKVGHGQPFLFDDTKHYMVGFLSE